MSSRDLLSVHIGSGLPPIFDPVGAVLQEDGSGTEVAPDVGDNVTPYYIVCILGGFIQELGDGQQGELCSRGHVVMIGYYKNEEATRQAIDDDGLSMRYHTHCDPRLNADQALELAFLIAESLKELRSGSGNRLAAAAS